MKSNKYYHDLIQQKCRILPFDIEGIILSVFITKRGIEYQCKYYLDGEVHTEYFFDWEVEVI